METQYPATPALPPEIDLAQLPSVLGQNQALAQKANIAISAVLDQVKTLDLQKLDPVQGDAFDAQLSDLAIRGNSSIELNKERRMVFTRRMDEVKSLFTSAEALIKQKVDEIKIWRDSWNKEKHRRIQEQQAQAQRELDMKNAAVEYTQSVVSAINAAHSVQIKDMVDRLIQAFYANTLDSFPEYEGRLRSFIPQWTPCPYNAVPHPLLDGEAMLKIRTQVEGEMYVMAQDAYLRKVTEERDRLIELIPSRKAELERIAGDAEAQRLSIERQQQEAWDRQAQLDKEAEELQKQTAANAEAEKMNNLFDQAAAATPAVQLSKGTVQKKKYTPTTHKAMVALLQWWVAKNMSLLTIDELLKKLSFVVTAANKALNDGEKIEAEGLLIEDDFSTRATKAKSA